MYVCICNGLKEAIVAGAIDKTSASSVSEVYRHLACKPQCGKCMQDIAGMINDKLSVSDDEAPMVAAE